MSNRIASAVFQSDKEAQIPRAKLRSAGLIQAPWFGFAIAVLFAVLAFEIGADRVWLLGVAGIAFAMGIIDWVGGSPLD
ncbi:MAG: hypothetical protein JO335_03945 [Sphingomonas sp.]|nr:hypothetical protein [Sphingomonas sp.]